MLSKKVDPIPTTAASLPVLSIDVPPYPMVVSKIDTGYPDVIPVQLTPDFFKWNSNPKVETPTVVVVNPVTIPENPWTILIPVTSSYDDSGNVTKTLGRADCEYPKPSFVIVVSVIVPLVIVAVAVAKVETPATAYSSLTIVPTPTPNGAEIKRSVVAPTYPEPPLTISSDEIVPAVDTTALIAADTLLSPGTINPPKLIELLYPNRSTSSTNISLSVVEISLIILVVGYINGSIESLVL